MPAPVNAHLIAAEASPPAPPPTVDEALAEVKRTTELQRQAEAAHDAARKLEREAGTAAFTAKVAANRAFLQLEVALGRKGTR